MRRLVTENPVLTPEQVQDKMLALITGRTTPQALTPEWMQEVTGLKFLPEGDGGLGDRWYTLQETTEGWRYAFDRTVWGEHDVSLFMALIPPGRDQYENAPQCTLPLEPFLERLRASGYELRESHSNAQQATEWSFDAEKMGGSVRYYYTSQDFAKSPKCVMEVTASFVLPPNEKP